MNESSNEKITKKQKAQLQARYDYARDMIENGRDITDVRDVMKHYWKSMIIFIDPKDVFELVCPTELLQNFDFLQTTESTYDAAKECLRKYLNDPSTEDFKNILSEYYFELMLFGIRPSDYANDFAKNYAKDYIGEIDDLPDILSADRLIENVTMRDILDDRTWYTFDDFLQEFIKAGGDGDLLKIKFLKEIGYSNDYKESSALFNLFEAGCSVDINKLSKCIDVSILGSEEKARYCRVFKEHGASEKIIKRFSQA